jgi:DNA (cytosine-5)-methyltransferase 1
VTKLRVLDLFSGIGGFSLGLERTGGFETVAFCEIDPFCQRVLAKHWPHVCQFEDVTKLKGEDVGPVDVICGGFPCQDISTAGSGAGLAGERSGLWREYARLVGELRPSVVIVENVAALLGRGLDRVLGDLAEIGYDAEWHCIPASAVGAPHIRDRIWIIAYPQHPDADSAGSHRAPLYIVGKAEPRNEQERQLGQVGALLADPKRISEHQSKGRCSGKTQADGARRLIGGSGVSGFLADAISGGRPGPGQLIDTSNPAPHGEGQAVEPVDGGIGSIWRFEPDVGRVANGVPDRAHRLKALGNAVVPQIPELIGRAILAAQEAA